MKTNIKKKFLTIPQVGIVYTQHYPTSDNSVVEGFIREGFLFVGAWKRLFEPQVTFGPIIELDPKAVRMSRNSLYGWSQDVADRIQALFDEIPRSGQLANQIGSFLCENPDLIKVIDETKGKIPFYFGNDASLELRLLMDDEDDVTLLALAVRTSLDVDSAFDALNRFEDEWYFERFNEAITNFIIDISFK